MNFLIVGAGFLNKGAQSMLFITVDELKKRFPGCSVSVGTYEEFDTRPYTFERVKLTLGSQMIAMGGLFCVAGVLLHFTENVLKRILRGKRSRKGYFELVNCLKRSDAVIDISGFALGDGWGFRGNLSYLLNIRLGKKYGIPVFLMPQSFGPFTKTWLRKESEKRLKYPEVIYAREQPGYDMLADMGLKNVKREADLVLMNRGIDPANIYTDPGTIDSCAEDPGPKKRVGIIPNGKCFKNGDPDRIIRLYVRVIDKLISDGYEVSVFRHATEDLSICKKIVEAAGVKSGLTLDPEDHSCIEYGSYVKRFDFIICSRYHGIVHAFRSGVPSVALAWADKYQELYSFMEQDGFVFDITGSDIDEDAVLNAIDQMESSCHERAAQIGDRLKALHEAGFGNCFNEVENIMKDENRIGKK